MDKPICCLEITSSGIKLVVGYIFEHQVYILHALESTGATLVNGSIIDRNQMVIAIKELINSASKTLNLSITSVVLGLPSSGLVIEQSRGETNTTEADSHIVIFDADNCLAMITKEKSDPDNTKMIVDIVPYQYITDGNVTSARFPAGKISKRIAMAADVELMDSMLVKSYLDVVLASGLKIDKMVNVTNASIKYISSFQNSFSEYLFLDLGARQTTIGYAYDNRLYRAETINYGSDNITDAIAHEFNLTTQRANYYKEIYGLCKEPGFMYVTKEGFKLSALCETTKKALARITDEINSFILGIDASARNIFILSGGGANLLGLDAYLSSMFQNRTVLFTPNCYGARNKSYTNCVAMLKYYSEYEINTSPDRPIDLTLTRMTPVIDKNGKPLDSPVNKDSSTDEPNNGGDERL